ncbi:MAG TPA: hypothetical protein VLX92_13270, partial [Kofleriaceae bacterium]|nr:hypothetical protein [Kofleriaceae bacterium]
ALAVECAAADGDPSHLQPATIVTEMFADASGWFGKNGESVTAVWDQAGGQMIACGRDGHGVRCSNGLDTSELAGFGSIRFPDLGRRVATTGALSVCGRGHAGVACARNAGGRWPATTLWSPVYADGGGWDQPVYGDTVQLADLDNDGRIDVCGRSHYGLLCAVQSRRGSYAFESEHLWTFDEARDASGGQPSKDGSTTDYDATAEDFSDRDAGGIWPSALAYYGTIQLVDVNHDGFADACGRAPDGIYCAFSTGVGFERKRLVVPLDFTDAQGWADPSHGATLRLGDLAGDGRIAACGRSAAGVVCAEGY